VTDEEAVKRVIEGLDMVCDSLAEGPARERVLAAKQVLGALREYFCARLALAVLQKQEEVRVTPNKLN